MKKINLLFIAIISAMISLSCTSEDIKEISGTLVFNEIGEHSFNINAENIEATITITGPNKGEKVIFENVSLYRTAHYTAKIGVKTPTSKKNELLSNLVVMYEVKEGKSKKSDLPSIANSGYVKIDWKGIY